MEEIAISEFKAKCLAVLERVRATKKPIRITRFGKPVAALVARQMPLHQDPADRILAATAAVLDLTLVTADQRLLGWERFGQWRIVRRPFESGCHRFWLRRG